jgi:probable rRNA maturation factor
METRRRPSKGGPDAKAAGMPATRAVLAVQLATRQGRLPSAAKLKGWARAALETQGKITIRVVGAAEGRKLNRSFRNKDYATNVLSFPYSEAPDPVQGDIVLCAPVIRKEAASQGKTLDAHFAHLTVHGVLHLRGYDHEKPRAARAMETLETSILAQLGYPDPYAPAAQQ